MIIMETCIPQINSVTEKWEPSLAPQTREQVVFNLFFIKAYSLEMPTPIDYDEFFHPDLEWELHLDYPDIAGDVSVLFFDPIPEKVLFGIQYATVREITNHYPELKKYLNLKYLSYGKVENQFI